MEASSSCPCKCVPAGYFPDGWMNLEDSIQGFRSAPPTGLFQKPAWPLRKSALLSLRRPERVSGTELMPRRLFSGGSGTMLRHPVLPFAVCSPTSHKGSQADETKPLICFFLFFPPPSHCLLVKLFLVLNMQLLRIFEVLVRTSWMFWSWRQTLKKWIFILIVCRIVTCNFKQQQTNTRLHFSS